MDYFDNQALLRAAYNYNDPHIAIDGSATAIINCSFRSEIVPERANTSFDAVAGHDPAGLLGRSFAGNYSFTYPVFLPDGIEVASGAIVLLHGLNERNWNKYLYWARYLAENTGKAVILFPMAFHMNRSPGLWSDPRAMQEVAVGRGSLEAARTVATPINAALSTRLDCHPEWFCTSGLQSCYDLISLTRQIHSGAHPLFRVDTSVDFFAYSVGAFLLEVLLIANPDEVFSESKSYLFLGGSSFEQMQGISRYIMDARAFNQLEEAFIRRDPKDVREKINIEQLGGFNQLWTAFMAMLRLDRFQALRERSFHRLSNQIQASGLSRDQVIPAKSILRTLWGGGNRSRIPFTVLDFPYPYTHENPFPMGVQEIRPLVNAAFQQVFSQAAAYLR
jgi:hypothetical protein